VSGCADSGLSSTAGPLVSVSVAFVMDSIGSRLRAVLLSYKVIASLGSRHACVSGWMRDGCSGLLAWSLVALRPPWRTTLGQCQVVGTTIRTRVQRGLSDYSNRVGTVSNAKPADFSTLPRNLHRRYIW